MNNTFKKHKQKIVYALLLIILGIGLYLRLGGVLTQSFAFTYDVGRDLLQVRDIVEDFKIPLIGQTSGLGGLYYGPWWYYILTPAFIISSGNPQGIALFMVSLGILTILTGFFLGKKISGYKLALVLAALLSASDAIVASSTQIWNPNLAPFLVLLFFLCFYIQSKTTYKNVLLSALSGFILGIILDSEIVFGVLFIGGIVLSSIFIVRKEILNKRLLYVALGFIFTLLPRIFFELRHNFVMSKSLTSVSGEQSVLNIKDFFIVLPDRFMVFMGLFSDTFGVHVWAAWVICIGVAVVWAMFYKFASKMERKLFMICAVIITVFIIGSSLFARAIWGHYLVGIPVIYAIIVAISLVILMRKYFYFGVFIFLIILFFSSKPLQIVSNFKNPNWEGNAAVYRNQVAVIDYIYKDANGKSFNYTAYTPSVHDYPYRYLFSWYGERAYGYQPDTKASKSLYMILEPDPGYEGRLVDWLKIREGDGKVLDEKVIKGGIKVQKRTR